MVSWRSTYQSPHSMTLTARQQREIEYHRNFAAKNADRVEAPVDLAIVEQQTGRKWWNAYWATYDRLLVRDLRGKQVLVPGCGFGDDAIRLTKLGAKVFAFDISP